MQAHKHAELMALYAQDAMETDKPWERWQFSSTIYQKWTDLPPFHPTWECNVEYRRKPRTIRIGEYDVPEPLRAAPERGTYYFVPAITHFTMPIRVVWSNDDEDAMLLERRLVHLTKEAAESHALALLSLSEVQK